MQRKAMLLFLLALFFPPAYGQDAFISPAYDHDKFPGKKLALSLYWVGSVMDVESTQRCLNAGSCHEVNPLMPTSRAGQYGIKLGIGIPLTFAVIKTDNHIVRWIAFGLGATFAGAGAINLRF